MYLVLVEVDPLKANDGLDAHGDEHGVRVLEAGAPQVLGETQRSQRSQMLAATRDIYILKYGSHLRETLNHGAEISAALCGNLLTCKLRSADQEQAGGG